MFENKRKMKKKTEKQTKQTGYKQTTRHCREQGDAFEFLTCNTTQPHGGHAPAHNFSVHDFRQPAQL